MSQTPMAQGASLRIGAVDFVSPDQIKVVLDIEAPESVALNSGGPRPFPRVHGYALIPVDDAYLVGQVEWLTIERSDFPKRRGVRDFGLVDLPFPLRKMSLNPLGTLRQLGDRPAYRFGRGADALPSVGTPVLLPTDVQLRSIVESGDRKLVQIGVSPLAGSARVCIDPDRLFGRHLAVLGNTGSGKSCSVAGIIRWSLQAARTSIGEGEANPNARFMVLDPNGEYSRAFSHGDPVVRAKVFKVRPSAGDRRLNVPLWFWNSAEWASFTQASPRTQRPMLKRALRELKGGRVQVKEPTTKEHRLRVRRYLSSSIVTIQRDIQSGAIKSEETKFGFRLKAIRDDLEARAAEVADIGLQEAIAAVDQTLAASYQSFPKDGKTIEFYRAFAEKQVNTIIERLTSSLGKLGGIVYEEGPDEDVPIPFKGSELADHLEIIAEQEGQIQYVEFLVARIRTLLGDLRINAVVTFQDHDPRVFHKHDPGSRGRAFMLHSR